MSERRRWAVGRKVVALMSNGVVQIVERDENSPFPKQDPFTLATGLPGVMGLVDVLREVEDQLRADRGMPPRGEGSQR